MAQDDKKNRPRPNIVPPKFLQYTIEQYMESPGLVKQTNEWLLTVYQHLSEKDSQLQHTEQELEYFKEEHLRLRTVEELLEERTRELAEKDKELQIIKLELYFNKKESLRTSIAQHVLSLLSAISFGVGINFVTSTPSNTAGGVLIAIGVALQSVAFYISISEARKNS